MSKTGAPLLEMTSSLTYATLASGVQLSIVLSLFAAASVRLVCMHESDYSVGALHAYE